MLFLIDYENVGNAGMKGCGYLDARDYVIVFHSEARRHMEPRILEQVTASGCAFGGMTSRRPAHRRGENLKDRKERGIYA